MSTNKHDTITRLRDWRGLIAWRLYGVAMPLLHTANRLCPDVPGDFHQEWEDGRRYGSRTTIESLARVLATSGAQR